MKSVHNKGEEELQMTKDIMTFVNFMDEEVDVAGYILPGVVVSDDNKEIVTVSEFSTGVNPKDLGPNPWSWAENEDLVKCIGKYWSDFRHRSVEFAKINPDTYSRLPQFGVDTERSEKHIRPLDIPITETSWGIIHGDAHLANTMVEEVDGVWHQTAIDLDKAQSTWFIADIGTEVWDANMLMWTNQVFNREEIMAKHKEWTIEAYGWDTTDAVLEQGCQWRLDFVRGVYLLAA